MEKPVRVASSEEAEVAVGVTVSVQIGQGRSIVLQTAIPRDARIEDYHDSLDKLGRVVDRQEARYRLLGLKDTLGNRKRSLEVHEKQFGMLDTLSVEAWKSSGRKGDHKFTPAEVARKDNLRTNVEQARLEIAHIEDDIKACEAMIEGA